LIHRAATADADFEQASEPMQIPFVDLNAQYSDLRDEIRDAIDDALESMDLLLGPNVLSFESEFASLCRTEHAIGVGSGTDALYLALRACDIGRGDEVITVSHSFFATASAIIMTGATPVFVDVDPATYTIDPAQIRAAITMRTRAIVPVHLYGRMADMASILEIAHEHGLRVVEDACQAHGAEDRLGRAGSLGDAAAFSFYMSKNLGAYGEAGAVTTRSGEIADRVRRLRSHGSDRKYEHLEIGLNSRLDELQAAILRVKLRRVEAWNARRRSHAQRYHAALEGLDVVRPALADGLDHVFHLYVIQVPPGTRDDLQGQLSARGIASGIHYPIPIHRQPALQRTVFSSSGLSATEALSPRILSLPMYPEMTDAQIQYVASSLQEALPRPVQIGASVGARVGS
jgi:dTDP-4-amino-4,6-dideoxygalactose transaminase